MIRPAPRHAPPQPPSDAELVASLSTEDLSSLGVLFDRHALDVRRFLRRLGVTEGDADDLLQATFMLVGDASPSFRGGAVRAWIFGLAANLVRRHRRSIARMAARVTAWAREHHTDAPATPGESLDTQQQVARAARALERLSDRKREVFVMVVMEGMDAQDVASALGIPIGTVWTRLHHARRELRAELEGESP